jgi:glycosyltransferase involved in cell wall biosynthesis
VRPVRVGVDGTSWVNRRGYGRFARNAVGRLIELDGETRYVVYVDEQSASRVELPARAERRTVAVGRPPAEAAAAHSRRGLADLARMTLSVSRDRPDAFLFPSVYTYFPVLGTPTVVGLHDTIAEDYPRLTLPNRRARTYASAKRALAVRLAARLFTVSEASREALADRLGITPERLAIVPEAPDPVFHPRTPAEVELALAPLGLAAGSFLLSAGGISPHKNLESLVAAYAELLRRAGDAPQLVLAGDLQDDPYLSSAAEIKALIAELGLGGRVLLPGFVEDETLACLYAGAVAVVLPSLAEGFGLPAVEAAACGAALVLSDLPAHRETLGQAALFVAPSDVRSMADALERVLGDSALRSSLAERARRAVSRLSWDTSAEALRRLIAEVVSPRRRRRA